ncbi:MAG TPA: efflux transporter periplasmic adaptor subunit, partial [Brevundimonas sp.]|nr:efflux transporter periplasmic adaptor subunit [Brevundimonas sp.]
VIRSGLAANDRVIISGLQRVQQPGVKVKATVGRIQPVAQEASAPVTTSAPASTASFANSASGQ